MSYMLYPSQSHHNPMRIPHDHFTIRDHRQSSHTCVNGILWVRLV